MFGVCTNYVILIVLIVLVVLIVFIVFMVLIVLIVLIQQIENRYRILHIYCRITKVSLILLE